uniref:Uncharacterized protein n=1 Tax=Strigamia maritima TaxID=126957 RepID=T1IHW0_STRMM
MVKNKIFSTMAVHTSGARLDLQSIFVIVDLATDEVDYSDQNIGYSEDDLTQTSTASEEMPVDEVDDDVMMAAMILYEMMRTNFNDIM